MHLNLDVGHFSVFKGYRKIFLVMRLVIFLLTITFLHASATTFSQTVTLSAKNISIEKVLSEVEKQTGFNLFYKYSESLMAKPIDVNFNKTELKAVLNKVLLDNGLAYKLKNKTIIILEAEERSFAFDVSKTEAIQQNDLTGVVLDKNTQQPLIGASVKVKGTTNGTVTDNRGGFALKNVKQGDVLQVFFMGFQAQELIVGNSRKLSISLPEDLANLDGIVVTGYATQKKREITGSISSIKASDIASAAPVTLDQAMQGRMSGVNIQSRVGVPGAAMKIEIRGPGSITAGTSPIYVVDGLIVNTANTSNVVSTNPLAVINPDDIETIEVLKDAAAASVYGAQAGNGVILITTKKGKAGKLSIDASYRGGVVSLIKKLPVTNSQQYIDGRMDAYLNSNPNFTSADAWAKVAGETRLPANFTAADIANLPTYDWQEAAYAGGKSGKYDVAVAGGTDKNNYRISASFENSEGAIIASEFLRGTVNFNYSNKLTDKIEFSSTVNLSSIKQNGAIGANGTSNIFSSPSYAGPMMLPFNPIYNPDGSLNVNYSGLPGTLNRNIVHSALVNEMIEKNNGVFGNMQLKYNILSNLSVKAVLGLDYRDLSSRMYWDLRSYDGYARQGTLEEYTNTPITYTASSVLQYQPNMPEKHSLNALMGVEYRSYENQSTQMNGEKFPNYLLKEMASAALITKATSNWTGVKRLGSFFQSNYSYDGKYMLSAIIRYDGSSRFGQNSRFGFFPSLSAGWDISREDFVANKRLFNQLKLRFGYGQTGNDQIGNFVSRSLYSSGANYNNEPGIQTSIMGNSKLRWEKNVTTNLALDYSLFNNKIFGSVEVYNRLSKDLLLEKPVAWVAGYDSITDNLGEVQNKGLEFEIGANLLRTEKFTWTTNFNISFQKNEVKKLYDGLTTLPGDNSVNVGYPLTTYVVPQYAGVNAANGKPIWYDKDGNYSYNPDINVTTDFYAPYGFANQLPTFYGGFNNTFSYRGFSLGVFFQYDYGRVLNDAFSKQLSRKGDMSTNGLLWYYENRWVKEGQITSVPRSVIARKDLGNVAVGDLNSTRYFQDASYIRLKNVSLGYTLPKSVISKLNLRSLKLYAQANNLYTITKFKGYDPEFFTVSSEANNGVIPATKSFYFGIQLGY